MSALSREFRSIFHEIKELQKIIMSTNADVLAGIAQVKQDAADNAAAVVAEIAKLDATIATLTTGQLTPEQIAQAASDLAAISTTLKGTTATAAAAV